MRTLVGFLLLGVAWMAAAPPGQESVAIARLQQEVGQLRFELDSKADRLAREVEQLRLRLNDVQYAAKPLAPAPAPPVPAEPAPAAASNRDQLTVGRLVIEDATGAPRIVVAVSDRYGPMVAILSQAGDVQSLLASGEDGPRLEFFDALGESIARFPGGADAREPE